ncbi:hypothetical protein [Nonomuraea endophytica]|uniref:hypothetical protein n=1 Tax=Nonomuraea endophytica TaxID=714136 RepID=UPI0037CC575A
MPGRACRAGCARPAGSSSRRRPRTCTGTHPPHPKIRNRSTSLRTARVVTPAAPATFGPDQSGPRPQSHSRARNRTEVSDTPTGVGEKPPPGRKPPDGHRE